MDQKHDPARTRPSETTPEDLHVPEHEPPSMPETADKPDRPAAQPNQRAATGDSGPAEPKRPASAAASKTTPDDLHIHEQELPTMPEVADKPDQPSERKKA